MMNIEVMENLLERRTQSAVKIFRALDIPGIHWGFEKRILKQGTSLVDIGRWVSQLRAIRNNHNFDW